jgi:hypothetical protein
MTFSAYAEGVPCAAKITYTDDLIYGDSVLCTDGVPYGAGALPRI